MAKIYLCLLQTLKTVFQLTVFSVSWDQRTTCSVLHIQSLFRLDFSHWHLNLLILSFILKAPHPPFPDFLNGAISASSALIYSFRVKVKSLSRVGLLATPWTVAYQAPLSMGFSRQGTGVGCHFLLQGIFPTQGPNLGLLHSRQTL